MNCFEFNIDKRTFHVCDHGNYVIVYERKTPAGVGRGPILGPLNIPEGLTKNETLRKAYIIATVSECLR